MARHDPKQSSDNFGSDAARLHKGQHYLFRITLELTES